MSTVDDIKLRLTEKFMPSYLNIIDESHKHIGHPGARAGGGHYRVQIASDQFAGLSKLVIHRLIYQALEQLMTQKIHALAIELKD